jgi:hypothetical protein
MLFNQQTFPVCQSNNIQYARPLFTAGVYRAGLGKLVVFSSIPYLQERSGKQFARKAHKVCFKSKVETRKGEEHLEESKLLSPKTNKH